ncbi:MAG TPA: TlpA disulfide reductase family protein [Acidimicrobiales bacterium]|nr:TlpA disulfide reductase family protein [Acidimicrobiales bacterium]
MAIAVILISIVSLATSNRPSASGTTGHTTTTLATTALVGTTVKPFTMDSLKGGALSSPWSAGHPAVLIFFASYCGPCQSEMPKVAAYLRAHNELPVKVMGVDASDQRGAAQSFIAKNGVTFPVGFDPNDSITSGIFKFETIPETVFVSARGTVTKVYFGAIPTAQLAKGIASLKAA